MIIQVRLKSGGEGGGHDRPAASGVRAGPRGDAARPVRGGGAPAGRPRVRPRPRALERRRSSRSRPRSPTRPSPTRSPRCSGPRRRAGLAVAPQGTGHGAAPLEGRLGDAVLLRTAALGELSIDPDRRIARVGAGVLWGDLADAAGTVGLAGLHPSSPDVGVVGYSIGGGIGWYARRLGLQCNAITAVEVVLADGTFVRATADADAELFWGLRGGGAPLGVVTALEFELFAIDSVVAGFLAWDWTQLERVLPGVGGLVRRRPGRR